jgi:hypothetical protein
MRRIFTRRRAVGRFRAVVIVLALAAVVVAAAMMRGCVDIAPAHSYDLAAALIVPRSLGTAGAYFCREEGRHVGQRLRREGLRLPHLPP